MRGHLQCRDTLAGNEGCPLKTGTTVFDFNKFEHETKCFGKTISYNIISMIILNN